MMILDLGPTVEDEGTPLTIMQYSGGVWDENGEWTTAARTPVVTIAAIQPAAGRALRDLAEGERVDAKYFIWVTIPLVNDDHVIYNGFTYRVINTWPRPDGGYTKAVLGLLKHE